MPLAVLLFAAVPSWAQVERPSRVSLTWENDVLAGTDRHYTNGMRIELVGRVDPGVLPWTMDGDEAEWGLAIGQRIYTPEQLEATGLVADDRPYAGWSYVAASIRRRSRSLRWEDRIELTLGVVGPASGAQAVHELAHSVSRSARARGWHHQLRDEPGFALSYRASPRLLRGDAGLLGFDVTPCFGVSVGNVATFVNLGLGLRCGLGVPDEYAEGSSPPLRVFLTASAEVRLVGYDVFLDGNLLRSRGHRVDKERIVADLSLGLVMAIHDRVGLNYVHTLRTPEFVGQIGGDQFGSLSLVLSW